jgi:hypothetical protein
MLISVSGNVLKPSLDLLLFNYQLSRSLGARGSVLLFINYYATVALLRAVTPAFGRLAAVEAKLEGEYRRGMGRVGRESEEIACVSSSPFHLQFLIQLQLLQWWIPRTRHPHQGLHATDQARQLHLQNPTCVRVD